MKITIINGSPRNGNTCEATQIFKNEMLKYGSIEFTEFSLPKDMPNFCHGCMNCFEKGENFCPNTKYVTPILNAMLESDAIIMTTPVYVLNTVGTVKSFLDHFGFMFLVHRANPKMFTKKAFIIATTAGGGTGTAIKTIATSLKFWGINRVYSSGYALFETTWDNMKPKRKAKFESKIQKDAKKFYFDIASRKKHLPYFQARLIFAFSRMVIKGNVNTLDYAHWENNNWFEKSPF